MQSTNLKNQLLIAMPGLRDPNFTRTVTYICEHSESGAMGIVINRPTDIHTAEVFEQMQITPQSDAFGEAPVYLGGPVEEQRGFILHNGKPDWDSSLQITEGVNITTSRDILEAMACGQGPQQTLMALGYAGWTAGQLEQEILDNTWLCGPAESRILFDLPSAKRWEASAKLLGVDLNLMSNDSGHA